MKREIIPRFLIQVAPLFVVGKLWKLSKYHEKFTSYVSTGGASGHPTPQMFGQDRGGGGSSNFYLISNEFCLFWPPVYNAF